ncbi:DUF4251 domain-containing protein [Aggregatimonas sangjinii]|nr:DUF4251 domain-containing protein [Aggregatimonas sangjinii]
MANADLDTMVQKERFEFNARTARPMVTNAISQIAQSGLLAPGNSVGRIDLGGTANFLKIAGDSVSANLAYYGERQLGGGAYGNNTGIVFEGVPQDMEITKDEKKERYNINFSIKEDMEWYNVYVQINPNLSGTVDVVSSHRTRIGYTGTVNALQEEE